MKIAVLYAGLPRCIKKTFVNHKQYIFDNHDYDTFFYFWNVWGYTKIGNSDTTKYTNILTDEDISGIVDTLHPVDYKIHDLKNMFEEVQPIIDGLEKLKITSNTGWVGYPHGIAPQFYGLQLGYNLINSYAMNNNIQYDVVIRLRTDIAFCNADQASEPKPLVIKVDDALHTYAGYRYGFPLTNDQVGYGSMKTMASYCNVYSSALNYETCHPESILGKHIQHCNIPIVFDWDVHYNIIREE